MVNTRTEKPRRAYIGNLRPRPNLAQSLHDDLFVPHCLVVRHDGGDAITVVPPATQHPVRKHAHALVAFRDVDYAIQVLDGVHFDGRILRVNKEKKRADGGGGNNWGWGSSRWASSHKAPRPTRTDADAPPKSAPPNNSDGGPAKHGTGHSLDAEKACRGMKPATSSEIQENREHSTSAVRNISQGGEGLTNSDFQTRCQLPLSALLEEYGEQDVDWKKDQQHSVQRDDKPGKRSIAKEKARAVSRERRRREDSEQHSMLAHYDKACIRLELVSFGFKYGAPSYAKKGFTFAHPLPPLDVRDLDRAPAHVSKFTGLSYLVKKALLNPSCGNRDEEEKEGDNAHGGRRPGQRSPVSQRANDIADEIIRALVEAIDEGGHGALSPLQMTINVGSEYGRHRSVVLVEHLAVVLRARLRRNDGRRFDDDAPATNNGIVKQPVSVSTRHRDVDACHQDEEAFGEDLKREARKAEKVKRKQTEEDVGWDDHGW